VIALVSVQGAVSQASTRERERESFGGI